MAGEKGGDGRKWDEGYGWDGMKSSNLPTIPMQQRMGVNPRMPPQQMYPDGRLGVPGGYPENDRWRDRERYVEFVTEIIASVFGLIVYCACLYENAD